LIKNLTIIKISIKILIFWGWIRSGLCGN